MKKKNFFFKACFTMDGEEEITIKAKTKEEAEKKAIEYLEEEYGAEEIILNPVNKPSNDNELS